MGDRFFQCYTFERFAATQGHIKLAGSESAVAQIDNNMLKGFSLRGMTALTFGLAIGAAIAWLISISPLLNPPQGREFNQQTTYLVQMTLFVICTYLGTVIALRGKDDFNLVIPYVRFVPHEVDAPVSLVDKITGQLKLL